MSDREEAKLGEDYSKGYLYEGSSIYASSGSISEISQSNLPKEDNSAQIAQFNSIKPLNKYSQFRNFNQSKSQKLLISDDDS